MDNNDIIELLDILYGMVNEAWGVPLGNDKCIIEREKAIEIINEIKANLPSAIAEAQRLVSARDEFIGNAKREAEALRKNAEEQARVMIEEQEVVRVAKARSNEMISSAEIKSKELRRVASEYVENLMHQTEQSLSEALNTVKTAHNSFSAIGSSIQSEQMKQNEMPTQPVQKKQPQNPAQKQPQAKVSAPQTHQKQAPAPTKVQRIQRDEEE